MTTSVEKSITVDAPLSMVYNQWTQFEEFPQFMGGVREVRQLSDTRIHWVAEIAGVRREWDADILEQVPDEKIAWAATEGATNAGAVHFSSTGTGQTLVRLSLEYEPEGLVEKAGDQLNLVGRQAASDLEKFKKFIEARGMETGAWAGSVNEGAGIDNPGVEAAEASRGDSGHAGVSAKAVATGAAAAAAVVAAGALASKSSGDSEQDVEVTETTPREVDVIETDVVVVETDTAPTAYDDGAAITAETDAGSGGAYTEPIEATHGFGDTGRSSGL
jgi:uncharacterized protein YndB with AHSA1/START domain